ncbi:MAG: PQQ-binding-like beta-propeller repeat protein, partial [Candidatus Eremiobacterota bacterium]
RFCSARGDRLWSVDFRGDSFSRTTPVVGPDGTVFFARRSCNVGSQDANMEVVAFREGRQLWAHEMGGDYTQPPQLSLSGNGTLCVAGAEVHRKKGWIYPMADDRAALVGLDPATGKERFVAEVPGWTGYVRTCLSAGPDGNLYACHSERQLSCYAPDGSHRWTYTLKGRVVVEHGQPRLRQSPSFDRDGNLLISTGTSSAYPEGYVIKLDRATGRELWRVNVQGGLASRPEPGPDGTIYATTDAGDLLSLTPDGQPASQTRVGGSAWNNLAVGPGGLLYLNTDSQILAFQPDLEKMTAAPPPVEGLEKSPGVQDRGEHVVVGGVRIRKARR